MKYFVLKPKGTDVFAVASRNAMREYANTIWEDAPEFASAVRAWADKETKATDILFSIDHVTRKE
jgi:hypothetical protein